MKIEMTSLKKDFPKTWEAFSIWLRKQEHLYPYHVSPPVALFLPLEMSLGAFLRFLEENDLNCTVAKCDNGGKWAGTCDKMLQGTAPDTNKWRVWKDVIELGFEYLEKKQA